MRHSLPIFVIAISALALMAAPALTAAAAPLRQAQADDKPQEGAERQIVVEQQEPSVNTKPKTEETSKDKAEAKEEAAKDEAAEPGTKEESAKDEAAEPETKEESAKDEAATPETKDESAEEEAATGAIQEPAKEEAAAEEPVQEEGAALAVEKLSRDQIILVLQQELNRVGCYQTTLDGKWGPQSHRALEAFGHFAKIDKTEFAPSAEWAKLVQEQAEEVCPPNYAYTPRYEPSYGAREPGAREPRQPRRSYGGGYPRRSYGGYPRRSYDGYGPGGYYDGYRGPYVGGY